MGLSDLLCFCCKPFKDSQELNIKGRDHKKTAAPQLSYLERERNIFAPDALIAHILQIIKSEESPGYIKQPLGDMGIDPSAECEALSSNSLGENKIIDI